MSTSRMIGTCEILEVIAQGPSGTVYKALEVQTGHTVVVKTFNLAAPRHALVDRERFNALYAKVQSWRRLVHPNVVSVFDAGEDQGTAFLVLEYVNGAQTLASILASGAPLSTGAVLSVAHQAAAALDQAHGQGVVHEDVRPSNVLVTRDLKVKVTDFGLRPDGQVLARDEEALLAAAPYMSPEQAADATLDARSDVFSLGVCVYEMLFRRLPFAVTLRPGERPLAFFAKVLASNPEDRYATAGEFVEALERWLEQPTGATGGGGEPAPRAPSRPATVPVPPPIFAPAPRAPLPRASAPVTRGRVAGAVGAVGAGIGAIVGATAGAIRGVARRLGGRGAAREEVRPADSQAPARHIPGDPAHDPVDAAVFAPAAASPAESVLVQVFVHMPEDAGAANALARESDPEAERRARRSLGTRVRRGARIGFDLHAPGLAVDDAVQSLVWEGRPESVAFGVSVPAGHPIGGVLVTVTATVDSVPAGHIKFKLSIDPPGTERDRQPRAAADEVKRYELAFVSYASSDRDKVLSRVQMLESLKIRYFQDVLSLDPGDRWQQQLYKHIDECDLFLLFWSAAAKSSEWVMKEVRYALARKAGDDLAPPEIKPVMIEGPPPVLPPPELAHLHFNDRVIYFMTRQG